MLKHPALRKYLRGGGRHRLVSFELPEPEGKRARPQRPTTYRATIADYANGRTLLVDGSLTTGDVTEVTESGIQPLPSSEEFEEAVPLVRSDRALGATLESRPLRP